MKILERFIEEASHEHLIDMAARITKRLCEPRSKAVALETVQSLLLDLCDYAKVNRFEIYSSEQKPLGEGNYLIRSTNHTVKIKKVVVHYTKDGKEKSKEYNPTLPDIDPGEALDIHIKAEGM